MDAHQFAEHVKGKLIVSVQALEDEPLYGADVMAKMANAVKIGGAVAIRANSPVDIRAIKSATGLPIIGLYKDGDEGVYITPTFDHAKQISDAGADVIALDCTDRPRPDGVTLDVLLKHIRDELGKPILADVSTLDEAKTAVQLGANFVAPTLSGYTSYSPQNDGPDIDLLAGMIRSLKVPVIAEGRIHTPEQAQNALDLGAWCVVVGSAITRPRTITARFAQAIQNR